MVRANASNVFRVTVVDDNGERIPTAQVSAKFTLLAWPTYGYPTRLLTNMVLNDDGAHSDLLANDCVYGCSSFIPGEYSNLMVQVQYTVTAPGTSLKANTNKVVNLLIK